MFEYNSRNTGVTRQLQQFKINQKSDVLVLLIPSSGYHIKMCKNKTAKVRDVYLVLLSMQMLELYITSYVVTVNSIAITPRASVCNRKCPDDRHVVVERLI